MNQNINLNDLEAFIAVAHHRSFRKAAEVRGVTASALSHTIKTLENNLNLRLLNRTTRSVTPTAAGESFLKNILPSIYIINQAINGLETDSDKTYGTLRLNIPIVALQLIAMPMLSRYHQLYPDVILEVVTDDRLIDITKEGFDAGIRFQESLSPDMIAVPIGKPQKFCVVASPDYLKVNEIPKEPKDLLTHHCIGRIFPSRKLHKWEFQKYNKIFKFDIKHTLAFSEETTIRQMAIEGHGIAYVYHEMVENDLKNGVLIELLKQWLPQPDQFYLYYYGKHQTPRALSAFVELIKK